MTSARPKPARHLPIETLSRDEVDRLLKACSRRAPSGLRDRALIALLFNAGLRIGEALALDPRDLDLDHGRLRVRRGKGDKSRTVGVPEGAVAILQQWLTARAKLGPRRSAPVFCQITEGKVGDPVAQANVRQMLRRRAARAGIDKRVHPHGFRHSHAAELASKRLPINVIQRQLGHSNAATTSRYIDHVAPEDVIDAVRNALG
jgi:integrase/recombinase XerD